MFPVYVLSPTFTVTGAPATGLPSSSVTLPVTFVGLPASAFLIGSTVKFASCLPTFAVVVLFADVLATFFSFFIALIFRFDLQFSSIPDRFLEFYLYLVPLWTLFIVVIFYAFRLYHSVWSFVSIE